MSNFYSLLAKKIDIARDSLTARGVSKEDMDNVFGEENFFFPTTRAKEKQTIDIIDNLITNNQYKASDKDRLVDMVETAYNEFKQAGKKPKDSKLLRQPVSQSVTKPPEETKESWFKKNKLWVMIGGGVLLLGTIVTIVVVSNKKK